MQTWSPDPAWFGRFGVPQRPPATVPEAPASIVQGVPTKPAFHARFWLGILVAYVGGMSTVVFVIAAVQGWLR